MAQKEPWQEAIDWLNKDEMRLVIARLLGRSGLSDEDFIKICKEIIGMKKHEMDSNMYCM